MKINQVEINSNKKDKHPKISKDNFSEFRSSWQQTAVETNSATRKERCPVRSGVQTTSAFTEAGSNYLGGGREKVISALWFCVEVGCWMQCGSDCSKKNLQGDSVKVGCWSNVQRLVKVEFVSDCWSYSKIRTLPWLLNSKKLRGDIWDTFLQLCSKGFFQNLESW